MEKQLKVGLVGYGFAGRTFHAPLLEAVAGLHLAKVVERHHNKARETYPSIETVRSVEQLVADPELDLVVVATPSSDHVSPVETALRAGKHVVVDKPFTATTKEADRLIELALKNNVVLSVFHNRRWDSDFLTIRQLLAEERLGDLIEYEARWDRYVPQVNTSVWREGGEPGSGVLYDFGSHFIDQALCLFGSPLAVAGEVKIVREGGRSDDYYEVVLDYGRLKVTLKTSRIVSIEGPRYVIHGMQGSYVKYGMDPQEAALKQGVTPGSAGWAVEPESTWGRLCCQNGETRFDGKLESLPGSYLKYYENVRDAILGRAPLEVTAEQARRVIRVIELAQESSRLDKRRLPFTS